MPPKEKPSKKNQLKKQDKSIEDRTFGLKNKNKSSKVQKYISQVETGVKNQSIQAAKVKDEKTKQKLAKQQADEELRILLNDGVSNQFGKKKSAAKEEAAKMGLTESVITLEFSDDSDEEEEEEAVEQSHQTSSTRHNYEETYEVEAIEVFKEKTIEDIIEEQRAKLAAEGKTGTPVTAETFAIWRADKLAKKQAAAEARMKAEMGKKKGAGAGKGLSVLSGKQLFTYNSSLFVDDDGAVDQTDEEEYQREQKLREDREEAMARAAAARAQEEQDRLLELHRVEMEQRKHEETERRRKASLSTATFVFNGITIREKIFDLEEKEDLSPFKDPEAPEFDEEDEEELEVKHADSKPSGTLSSTAVASAVAGEGSAEAVKVNEDLFEGDDDDLDDLDDDA